MFIYIGSKYRWDKVKNEWVTKLNNSNLEKPKGRKKNSSEENIEENDTDEDEEKEKTVARQDMSSGQYGYDGENHTYTDPKDGAVYFWDRVKNAWFPKVSMVYRVNAAIFASWSGLLSQLFIFPFLFAGR